MKQNRIKNEKPAPKFSLSCSPHLLVTPHQAWLIQTAPVLAFVRGLRDSKNSSLVRFFLFFSLPEMNTRRGKGEKEGDVFLGFSISTSSLPFWLGQLRSEREKNGEREVGVFLEVKISSLRALFFRLCRHLSIWIFISFSFSFFYQFLISFCLSIVTITVFHFVSCNKFYFLFFSFYIFFWISITTATILTFTYIHNLVSWLINL